MQYIPSNMIMALLYFALFGHGIFIICNGFVWYVYHINFMDLSMALRQVYDCANDSDVTMGDMGYKRLSCTKLQQKA